MASNRETYAADNFAANTFACETWKGKPFLSTSGIFTVTRIIARRTVDVSIAHSLSLSYLLGTVIYDLQADTWDGANYTITNASTDREYDADETSADELLDVLATVIADNPSATPWYAAGYTAMNYTEDYVLNCTSTSLDEIADVLGTLLEWRRMIPRVWNPRQAKDRTLRPRPAVAHVWSTRVDRTRNL